MWETREIKKLIAIVKDMLKDPERFLSTFSHLNFVAAPTGFEPVFLP
jgi:hypothetical protein